ncbi:osteocrin isoform X1 [Callorhinchus milii]|uniref:osteocrin isoform X1 n=1 Tax=Callorhinchus milii TaxID=7868 RepID=UPI00045726F1|nr:osteocrin isoform X1 [Callorhinchus milii]|eukprot:gi/632987884/ref/XP_007882804.1/ PREDICTED: osteocrin-like isoform X1 [Callorhinchus milii]
MKLGLKQMLCCRHLPVLMLLSSAPQWCSRSVEWAEPADSTPGGKVSACSAPGDGGLGWACAGVKAMEVTAKLHSLSGLTASNKDVTEKKRKRSFPNFSSPIDQISLRRQKTNGKPRNVLAGRRKQPSVPLDQIGKSSLPKRRG